MDEIELFRQIVASCDEALKEGKQKRTRHSRVLFCINNRTIKAR